ncbi:GroES-like protein [Meredithblackwellia eburnea MCA 4105]
MSSYKAAILQERGSSYSIVTLPIPVPAPTQLLVRLEATGVCHSDADAHTPKSPDALQPIRPLVGGHEGVGRIEAVGADVGAAFSVGDRVGLAFLASICEKCEACLAKASNHCSEAKYHGFTTQGTFQEYGLVDVSGAIPIPQSLSSEQAAPLLCAGLTVYKALKLAEPTKGEWVAVPGAGGGLGHLAIQYAKEFGLKVVAIDSASKADLAKSCGADAFIDFQSSPDVVSDVFSITGGGSHISLVAVGHPASYAQAVAYTRTLGRVLCVGLAPMSFHTGQIIGKGIKVIGSFVGTREDAVEALHIASKGLVRCSVENRNLEDLEETIADLEKGNVSGRVVIKL